VENSFNEKRLAARVTAGVAVEILHNELEGTIAETSDLSESGILVVDLDGAGSLKTGMEVEVKITGLMGKNTEVRTAKVVRVDDQGVALQFNEPLA
jgi:hypothetical protein